MQTGNQLSQKDKSNFMQLMNKQNWIISILAFNGLD